MALAKLQALTAHLLASNLVLSEQLDSWMENGEIKSTSKKLGNGLRVGRMHYDAIFTAERYYQPPQLLFALVITWLMDHDEERYDQELPDPSIEVEIIDRDLANIEITVRFSEDLDLVAEDTGAIRYQGQTYALAQVPIDIPDQAAVGDNKGLPTDAPGALP